MDVVNKGNWGRNLRYDIENGSNLVITEKKLNRSYLLWSMNKWWHTFVNLPYWITGRSLSEVLQM